MKFLKRILSGPDTVESVIDGAKKGLDALVFTSEERAAHGAEAFALVIQYMQATQAQNVARRYIALVIVALWALLVVAGVVLLVLQTIIGTEADPAGAVFGVIGDYVTNPLMLVLGFYFATHMLRAWSKPPKGKH